MTPFEFIATAVGGILLGFGLGLSHNNHILGRGLGVE